MGKNCSKQQRSLTIVTRTAWNAMQCSIFATDFMVSSNLISHREGGIYPNEPCFQNRYHEDESPIFHDGTHRRRRLCLSAQRRNICGAYRLFKRLTKVFGLKINSPIFFLDNIKERIGVFHFLYIIRCNLLFFDFEPKWSKMECLKNNKMPYICKKISSQ